MTASPSSDGFGRHKLAAGLLLLAAAGHAIGIPHHADPGHGGVVHGAAFAAVAIAQLIGAAVLARRSTDRRLRVLVLASSVVFVALWAASRTAGLPYGPHPGEAESVGFLDALTVAAQLGVVGLLARPGRRQQRLPVAFAASIAVIVMGMAALNLAEVTEPAGATSHDHREQGDHYGRPSGVPGGARSAEPGPETSVVAPQLADPEDGHSHDDDAEHTHP